MLPLSYSTHSLILSQSYYHSLSFSRFLTHSLILFHSLTFPHSLNHSLTLSHFLRFSNSHLNTFSLSLTLSLILTHSLTHFLPGCLEGVSLATTRVLERRKEWRPRNGDRATSGSGRVKEETGKRNRNEGMREEREMEM